MRKGTILLLLVCIVMVVAAGCTSQSATKTPVKVTTVATPEPITTFVKITNSGGYLVIDITNNGGIYRDYMAVVIFYDGDVKLGPSGTHFATAQPGETVQAKIPIPRDATRYVFDGVGETIAGQMYKTHYELI